MLLPTNSSPIGFQQELYYSVTEKTKLFASKCANRNNSSPAKDRNDTVNRARFRFCVCTGPRKSKKTTKWYVKVKKKTENIALMYKNFN